MSNIDIISWSLLTGEIPASLENISRIHSLHLQNNHLTGSIPSEFGTLMFLQELYLYGNQLTGEIPAELGNLRWVREIFLYDNQLSGEIPENLGHASWLTYLDLHNNQLSGVIPNQLWHGISLEYVDISYNKLSGDLTRGFIDTGVNYVNLEGNQITGSIPAPSGHAVYQDSLNLSHNKLTGEIPTEYFSSYRVTWLKFNDNELSGPLRMANPHFNHSLKELHLQNNRISGPLPEGFGARPELQVIDLSGNAFTGAIPDTLGDTTGLRVLDLSSNSLEGKLPDRLGNLSNLTYLSVAKNVDVEGQLPSNFVNLSNLEFLAFNGTDVCGPRAGIVFDWLSQVTVVEHSRFYCDYSVDAEAVSEFKFNLRTNYPNPFRSTTNISYTLPGATDVKLEVFDLLGRRVVLLARGVEPGGEHRLQLDASDLTSGIYFFTLWAGDSSQTRKMVLLR